VQYRLDRVRHRRRGRPHPCRPRIARQVRTMGLVGAACTAGCRRPGAADCPVAAGSDDAAGAGRLRVAVGGRAGRLLSRIVPPAPEAATEGRGSGACERGGDRFSHPAQRADVSAMRHPLHPALVHFPVACWSLAVLADFASLRFGTAAWSWSGGLLAVGCAMAVLAMLAGMLELARVPEGAALQDAWWHMGAMLTALRCSPPACCCGWITSSRSRRTSPRCCLTWVGSLRWWWAAGSVHGWSTPTVWVESEARSNVGQSLHE